MAYLTSADLLAMTAGQTVDFDAPTLGKVKLRSLTVLDYGPIEQETNPLRKIAMTVSAGMVEPAVSVDDLMSIRLGAVELLTPIAVRINALSALDGGDDITNFPGGGS